MKRSNKLNAFLTLTEQRNAERSGLKKMSPEEIRFRSLLITFDKFPVSFAMASKAVGGEGRLNNLIEEGKIHYIEEPKIDDPPNKKRRINFAECLRYSKPRLVQISKEVI